MDTEYLAALAQEADDLATRFEMAELGNLTLANAASNIRSGSAGARRAIVKAIEHNQRLAEKADRLAAWEAAQGEKAKLRQYDSVVQFMAKDRGITLDEAQAIQDKARENYREAMRKGSIAEQMAKLEPK